MVQPQQPVAQQHVPLVRQVLVTNVEPLLNEFGKNWEFIYLVEENVTQADLDIYNQLIKAAPHANGLQKQIDALQPYVGKLLLKAKMRLPGRQYEFFIEPVDETVVHFVVHQNDPSINMNLEWPYTIEDDPEYQDWLESVLFRDHFFDESIFESSQTLYRVDLQDSLLEDAIYRGIRPAPFQKRELNDAVRDTSLSLYGHAATKWFHVNVHDNLARVVEQFGRYSYRSPLVPIYVFLQDHQAKEGGTTYAGLASARREWVVLFEDYLHISVHGERRFVESILESLDLK